MKLPKEFLRKYPIWLVRRHIDPEVFRNLRAGSVIYVDDFNDIRPFGGFSIEHQESLDYIHGV